MPPQLQALLQNRRLLIIIGGVVAAVIVVLILAMVFMGGGSAKGSSAKPLGENERVLVTTDNIGRTIEIQALMARQGIDMVREDAEGGKFLLRFQPEATTDDRDRALTTLVQSGLMDKNVGLEVFDKSDITASRDEKRIKLVRARNGEIARLIRKIPPIQDASVFVSIPEPTLFTKDKPMPTATVQVTLSPGERLNNEQTRSIINLLVGSVEDLKPENVSLTDTNGEVYNSVLGSSFEVMNDLQERDRYMEQKVRGQMDKLIGSGKYVVTVATYLRESHKEEMALDYAPEHSSLAKSSSFNEGLSSAQRGYGPGGPATSDIPEGLETYLAGEESANQGYRRNGKEVEFNAGKRMTSQNYHAGMLEDITIAVTVDENAYPENVSIDEMKRLIARSASPLVKPGNVTILTKNGSSIGTQAISPVVREVTWEMPTWIWWAAFAGLGFVLFLVLVSLMRPIPNKRDVDRQESELRQLRDLAENQNRQLQIQQEQAQQMMSMQQQQFEQLQAAQQQALMAAPAQNQITAGQVTQAQPDMQATLRELKAMLAEDSLDDEDNDEATNERGFASWIEA